NSTTPPWTSYHVLIAAGVLYALAFLSAGVLAASPRLLEFLFPAPPNSQGGDTNKWPGWLSDLLPARAVQAWLPGIRLALVLLGLRGGWTDPERPYWSVAAVLTASVVAAALAIWSRRQSYVYVSGLLANLAGVLVWVALGPDTLNGFVVVNALGLALASLAWSAIELALRQPPSAVALQGHAWPFAHAALVAALALLSIAMAIQVTQGWIGSIPLAEMILAWL